MAWFGLEKEKEIPVSLRFFIVGKHAFLGVHVIVEVASDFILLHAVSCARSSTKKGRRGMVEILMVVEELTSSSAMRFWISSAIRESR